MNNSGNAKRGKSLILPSEALVCAAPQQILPNQLQPGKKA
jgi:hypothetical protein